MHVDVIVCNYRTPDDLLRFLVSYQASTAVIPRGWKAHLYICDVEPVANNMFLSEWLENNLGSSGTLLTFDTNVGYAHAVNHAAAQSRRSEVIAIFNADVVLSDPDGIWRCAEALHESEDWGVLGPLQRDHRGRCTHPGIFGTTDDPTWRDGWMAPIHDGLRDVRSDAVTVMGSAYFVERSLWEELTECPIYQEFHEKTWGGKPEGAFLSTRLYYEETFCSYHALAHGWKVCYFGEVELQHDWHQSVDKNHMEHQAGVWFKESQEVFRAACDLHSIPRD